MANITIISKEYRRASYNYGNPYPDGWHIAFKFTGKTTTYYTFVKYDCEDVNAALEKNIANGQYDTWPW